MKPPQLFAEAIRHHQAGQLAAAEQIYRKILAQDSRHVDALQLLGVLCHQTGRDEAAVDLLQQAIRLNPRVAEFHNNLGQALERLGRRDQATSAYRTAIRLKPQYPEAHNNLGNALRAERQFTEAVQSYRTAIKLRPNYAEALTNLGNALCDLGNHPEAVSAHESALKLRPDLTQIYVNLGAAYQGAHEWEKAAAAFRSALARNPQLAEAHNNLGIVLNEIDERPESLKALQTAIALRPDYPEAFNNLGVVLKKGGEFEQAINAFQTALRLKPDFPEAHNNLGNVLRRLGHIAPAIREYEIALQAKPDYADVHNNLGNALADAGRFEESVAALQSAIRINPKDGETHNNLGRTLQEWGKADEAIAACQAALQLDPEAGNFHMNLGNVLKDTGDLDGAITHYRRALQAEPDREGWPGNLLLALHYHPDATAEGLAAELKSWSQRYAEPLRSEIRPHANSRDPNRRLRIGYVSPDLVRRHPVSRFLFPLFRNHDSSQFEIVCYSDAIGPDATTAQFQSMSHAWRHIAGQPDHLVAELIRADQIDILVDLAAHTGRNRLLTFARKPAPVQVTYLAYAGSTGLDTIDYRFSDPFLDPVTSEPDLFPEHCFRLPETYWCYQPADPSIGIEARSDSSPREIIFGCLNNFCKATKPTLETWCRLLERVPRSRLLLHSTRGRHRDRLKEWFSSQGIDPSRIDFVGKQTFDQYMANYRQIDVALDPFPFNGGTTSCDALWMGVPLVTLCGRLPVGRAGSSILHNAGHPELVAHSTEEYVEIAANLAADHDRRAALRMKLRSTMEASPLMDAPRFTRNVEAAYREIWRTWCAR